MKRTKTRGAITLLSAGLSVHGCNSDPFATDKRSNVVLVTVDTLRADKLGAYGGDVATPHIDRVASAGVLFENTATVAPLTLPAHASILTGTYPMSHGVRDNGGYYLPSECVTLAEVLRDEGYATGAFVSAFVLDSRWGLDQGFQHYYDDFDFSQFEDVSLGSVQRPGNVVLDEALRFMERVESRPFFTWIHLYDPHTPYDPPEPHRARYAGKPWGLYDGEVAFVDDLIGRLTEWLEHSSLAKDTVLVILGDHGEALEDHGELDHGFFIYDATMKVPFIVAGPNVRNRGRRVSAQVRSIDLMPTVLDWLEIPVPASVQGLSLRPLVEGDVDTLELVAYGESYYPRGHYGWSELRSLRTDALHFIQAPRPELYDIRNDPAERKNQAPERPNEVTTFREELETLYQRFAADAVEQQAPVELDEETRRGLEALGYLGGSQHRVLPSVLADPKDKIELHRLVKTAEAEASAGRTEEALLSIERAIEADPKMVEAHRIRGDFYHRLRDPGRAAESYRTALSLEPGYKVAAFNLALLDLQAGRVDAAEAGLRRVLEIDPRDNKSHFLLAGIQIARRDFTSALETLDRAIESTSDTAPFYTSKAQCYLEMGNIEAAEASIHRALELNPDVPRAHHYLGWIREGRGDLAGAIEAYQNELDRFPHDPLTFVNLSAVYRQSGDLTSEIAVLERAIAAIPRAGEPYVLLGRAYLDAGQPQRARVLLRQGLALSPSPEIALLGRETLSTVESARDE
ncbi:MAG TPA: sulfatase-like hydrolase/transferase [Vicinamibacteria bacterium]|nr:sulfatase-like hydrolase/transferase [Vicinamibacteria bacterium]